MRRMTKIRIASGRTHRRARIWQRSSGAAAVTNSSTLLARVVAARAVASSRWRQYARQTKFQIRIRIARQRTLGTVTRMPQDTLDRRVSELKISVRKWRFFGRAQCRIGEIRIQILPGKTPCDDNYYPSTDISFFFFLLTCKWTMRANPRSPVAPILGCPGAQAPSIFSPIPKLPIPLSPITATIKSISRVFFFFSTI